MKKPPPYHLRLNKAVDRFVLIDILRCFETEDLETYRYAGLGGPFLEDFKLLDSFFPTLRKVSFELDEQTFLRQKFNRPSRLIGLEYGNMIEKLSKQIKDDEPLIVWYDSTQTSDAIFEGFISLLDMVPSRSIIRVTMRLARREVAPNRKLIKALTDTLTARISALKCAIRDKNVLLQDVAKIVKEQVEEHTAQQGELSFISRHLPADYRVRLNEKNGLLHVLFSAIHNAAVTTLSPGSGRTFRLLNASCYSDNTKMLSVTGAVVSDADEDSFMKRFKGTEFASAKWADPPIEIDLPILTPKERLHLNAIMPVCRDPGKRLCKRLGFCIDDKPEKAESEMAMYNRYHRYYPMFAKVAL